jgi:uncharacterized RDD family membrane protein YckC
MSSGAQKSSSLTWREGSTFARPEAKNAPLLVSMNSPDPQPGLDPPAIDSPRPDPAVLDSLGVDLEEYFDPDMPDSSEQYFSASLEAAGARPRFVLDAPEEPAVAETQLGEAAENQNDLTKDQAADFLQEKPNDSPEPERSDGAAEHDWREQVSAKVSRYRSRKPRVERYPSLSLSLPLQFEVTPLRDETPPRAVADAPDEMKAWIENPEVHAAREVPVTMEATARVLEFPRLAEAPRRGEELADPVMGRPRIVEAPELLPPPPALGGILIEPVAAVENDRIPGLDVPLQSSAFSRRLLAGMVDVVVVATALAAFAYIFFRINGSVPPWRIAAESAVAVLALLWPAYQYAFLVFSKTTPGLWLSKLEVTRFDGAPASRTLRRWRVLASLLSCASLGLGYAWCFLDEDRLSWHDRITRTHLGSALTARSQDQVQKQPRINAD